MKGGKAPLGYTIVEVMIVLAVSGMMLVVASQFINDKQARTTFTQGVNDMASRIQNTIQQVSNGQYTDMQVYCTVNYGTNRASFSTSVGTPNKNCTYMGKMLHFVQGGTVDNAEERYEVFTLAGARLDDGSPAKPVTNLDDSAISPVMTDADPMLTRQETVPYHLRVKKITVDGGPREDYGVAFIQSLGELEGDSLKTGPQAVLLYTAQGLGRSEDRLSAANDIKPYVSGTGLAPASRVVICITDENRWAELVLGQNNNALSVTVNMRGTDSCA